MFFITFFFNFILYFLLLVVIAISTYYITKFLCNFVFFKVLIKGPDYIVVNFNPWNYSSSNDILEAFFKTLVKEISTKENRLKDELIKLFISYVKVAHNINLANIFKYDEYTEKDIKERINKLLIKTNKKIIVVIDDIDRLLPNEILVIFQTVKIIADFKNTIYILSYDKKNISALLNTINIDAECFIKKIVQVEKNIPKINEEILKIKFLEEIEKIPNSPFKNMTHIEKMYDLTLETYIKNIRDLNRFFNTFNFIY